MTIGVALVASMTCGIGSQKRKKRWTSGCPPACVVEGWTYSSWISADPDGACWAATVAGKASAAIAASTIKTDLSRRAVISLPPPLRGDDGHVLGMLAGARGRRLQGNR